MELETRLRTFLGRTPRIHATVYISRHAVVQGDVRLAAGCSVWPMAVLRGDINYIEVGEGTNIQDACVLHLADEHPTIVGAYTTVGHRAILHACTVGDECLIGMGATILDGAQIGNNCIIGAHTLVTRDTVIPPGSLVTGTPGRVVRQLSEQEQLDLRGWAEKYIVVARAHRDKEFARHGLGDFYVPNQVRSPMSKRQQQQAQQQQ
ncbi:gamma carbonic anhydrase family protein [Verrucomicrobia bacterium LW23]|nr:gamma carbonic anhydrase family protein [Verrucomicrobia bacterium LW23]